MIAGSHQGLNRTHHHYLGLFGSPILFVGAYGEGKTMAYTQPYREKFEAQLLLAAEVSRRLARRHRLNRDEAEDFNSYSLLKLMEDDYAALRSFQGRSSLATFLTVVVHRLFLDYRVQKWGKWRPTAEVRKLGAVAVELDRLVNRDGQALPNAIEIVHASSGGALSREQLFDLAGRLPLRQRPHFEGTEQLNLIPTDGGVEETLEGKERTYTAKRVGSVLTRALREMPAEDQLILKMRHEDGFTVREIATALHLDARPLYTRFEKCHRQLREILEEDGISWGEVSAILGWAGCDLEGAFTSKPGDLVRCPSKKDNDLNLPARSSKTLSER
jgi:RNA polymerase sigma factor (sigma-70 family)